MSDLHVLSLDVDYNDWSIRLLFAPEEDTRSGLRIQESVMMI